MGLTKTCSVDSILCLDACFTQRRKRSPYLDPHIVHPDTRFVSQAKVEKMEANLERARTESKRRPAGSTTEGVLDDGIYDDCEKTFKAAQENARKGTTDIYSDTAIMAAVCRHDIVLFLVNMTSAGERQHYALSLIEAVFDELPDDWRVGVLYDIGCQLDRSLRNVSTFLSDYRIALICISATYSPWPILQDHLCRLRVSCLRSRMALSDYIPPSQLCWLWIYRWRRM